MHGWLGLLDNEEIKDDVQAVIRSRFNKTLVYTLDNHDCQGWPKLPSDLEEKAREDVGSMDHLLAMASYEVEDTEHFPKAVFSKIIKSNMHSLKHRVYFQGHYLIRGKTICRNDFLSSLFFCWDRDDFLNSWPCSKLRNRLGIEKVGRLVNVPRVLFASSGQDWKKPRRRIKKNIN